MLVNTGQATAGTGLAKRIELGSNVFGGMVLIDFTIPFVSTQEKLSRSLTQFTNETRLENPLKGGNEAECPTAEQISAADALLLDLHITCPVRNVYKCPDTPTILYVNQHINNNF